MKIYSGKQKVGTLNKKIDLVVDFDDFFYYKSKRALITQLQRTIGIFLIITAVIFFVTYFLILIQLYDRILLLALIDGRFPAYELFPSLGTVIGLFGWYLLRDRNRFGERLEERNLLHLKKDIGDGEVKEIEIESFFSDNVSAYLEEGYKNHNEEFIFFLSKVLLAQPEIKEIIASRLPLDLKKLDKDLVIDTADLTFDNNFQECFLELFHAGMDVDAEYIDEYVMFVAFAKKYWKHALVSQYISPDSVNAVIAWIRNNQKIETFHRKWFWISKLKPTGAINRSYTSKATPTIDKYAIDYVQNVIDFGFVFSQGKDEIIQKILELLSKTTKPNVLISGEAGVGKTHLVKNIATLLVAEDVPIELYDMRMVVIDVNRILTQVTDINQLENIFSKMLDESATAGNCILVFENIEYVFEIREENRKEILNRLISYLEESNKPVIATANTALLKKIIKQNKSFSSLFENIDLIEPSKENAIQIVLEHVQLLEELNGVRVEEPAVRRVVDSANKIHSSKVMPDKAIELLEETLNYAKAHGLKFVDESVVDQMVSGKLGVNIGDINQKERKILNNLEDLLHKRIVGQNAAVESVAAALKRARTGLNRKDKPVASFLFFGPTGVGKTEIAKALAEVYFGHENKMVRVDMSEYSQDKSIEKLIGIENEEGEFQGGFLTDAVKNNPFTIVLFDEIEKASPKVLDLFLQILDEGEITDGAGKKVDFTQAIIIMTSNAGGKQIASSLAAGRAYREVVKEAYYNLQNDFRIELLNRFDKIIMFKPLNLTEIHQIIEKFLTKINENLSEQGVLIEWNKDTVDELSKLGFGPVYGARQLYRVVQEKINDEVASLIAEEKVKKGQTIHFKGLQISDIV
ncbi:ATP-dependent Clp protease ATP-binding subunit [Candidatus Dojkabacteria bacterium]|uniref:ATP-dependent Clp protease ATP-binding subunit n=1 Tax=Candidatus Dojkabacteria bacterium TaxID=2099670 RepID=A0A955L225_9BACT|nr:ATP-dependent Clp protease ATP-binding subunit [Candidatus Dojkabacteria bacterium]